MTPRATLTVGQHVLVRDAYNEFRKATVAPVPRNWRDKTASDVVTTRGAFPKAWIRFEQGDGWAPSRSIPWPIEDVFDNPGDAKAAPAKKVRNA